MQGAVDITATKGQRPRIHVALLGDAFPSLTKTPTQEYRGSQFKAKQHPSRQVVVESIKAPVLGYLPLKQRAEILWDNANTVSNSAKQLHENEESKRNGTGDEDEDDIQPILFTTDTASAPNLLGITRDAQIDMELIHFIGAEPDDPKLPARFWAESFRKVKLVGLSFRANDQESRRDVIDKWLPLIRHFLPSTPIMPIACWEQLSPDTRPVSKGEFVGLARKLGSECLVNYHRQRLGSSEVVLDALAWYAGRELSRTDRMLSLFKKKRQIKCVVT